MKRAVLLLNMGGPNDLSEVELFLRNMFSDPRILPMHPFLRKFIAKRIIKSRLNEAQESYEELGGKSPLTKISEALAKKVESILDMPVRLAMRYVPPFADRALMEYKEAGVEEIIAFPMYPQYSTTTTLSSSDDLVSKCAAIGYSPNIKIVEPYFADDEFIGIVVDKIIEASSGIDTSSYDLILSAHGLPMSIIESGDPYKEQVEASVVAVIEELKRRGVGFADIKLAYQSKVGNSAWLEPNLTDVLRHPSNIRVLIYPLSFTIDNSETLYELDIEHRTIAEKIGYEDYRVAKCPNDSEKFASFVAKKINEAI